MSVTLIDSVAGMLASPHHIRTPEGVCVVRAEIDGKAVHFALRDLSDRIQRRLSRGKFYEPEELEIIARHFPEGGTFVDIGANVGNHSLYALLYLGAARSIVFEPNPAAYELLVTNVILNGLVSKVDFSHLGLGLSDRASADMGLALREGNLGATSLVEGEGDIRVAPADALLEGQTVDFIKIDVEGMELAVLGGLGRLIDRQSPPIFIEVSAANRAGLEAWMETAGYAIAEEGRQFRHNGNFLLLPKEPQG